MNLIEIVPAHSREHKREIRRMAADVIPKDKTWEVVLLVIGVIALDVVVLARWWMSV